MFSSFLSKKFVSFKSPQKQQKKSSSVHFIRVVNKNNVIKLNILIKQFQKFSKKNIQDAKAMSMATNKTFTTREKKKKNVKSSAYANYHLNG